MDKDFTDHCEILVIAKMPFYDGEIDIERHCSFKAQYLVHYVSLPRFPVRICSRHKTVAEKLKHYELEGSPFKDVRLLTDKEKADGWYDTTTE